MIGLYGGLIPFFNEKGDAPPTGQKLTGKNSGHLRAYAPSATVGADIDPAYLVSGKRLGAGIDFPDHLAVQLRHEDAFGGEYMLQVKTAGRRVKFGVSGKDLFLLINRLKGEKRILIPRQWGT